MNDNPKIAAIIRLLDADGLTREDLHSAPGVEQLIKLRNLLHHWQRLANMEIFSRRRRGPFHRRIIYDTLGYAVALRVGMLSMTTMHYFGDGLRWLGFVVWAFVFFAMLRSVLEWLTPVFDRIRPETS
jgi:hypothetical protein